MTNFQIVTQNPDKLDQLLYMVQDDALAAKGCSYEMQLPPNPAVSWKEWLERETNLDICETCIAKEYGISVDELRAVMEKHYGLTPCFDL